MSAASTFLQRLRARVIRSRAEREDGNSIVIWVMMAPVLFGAAGVAVDFSLGSYLNNTLQSGLDASVQSTLSSASNQGLSENGRGTPRLTAEQAKKEYRKVYDFNRRIDAGANESPTLLCQSAAAGGPLVNGGSGCNWTEKKFQYNRTNTTITLNVTVYEESRPVFIQILGFDKIQYNPAAAARLDTSFRNAP